MIRSFIAIELPQFVLNRLEAEIDRLKINTPNRAIRWARSQSIHLTLKFLGDISDIQIEKTKKALIDISARFQPFMLEIGGLGAFPNIERPRVLWVGVADLEGRLVELHTALEAGCAELGYKSEGRPFKPHLTLGRLRRQSPKSEVDQIAKVLKDSKGGTIDQIVIKEVILFRSQLKPTGAVYTRLKTAVLAEVG